MQRTTERFSDGFDALVPSLAEIRPDEFTDWREDNQAGIYASLAKFSQRRGDHCLKDRIQSLANHEMNHGTWDDPRDCPTKARRIGGYDLVIHKHVS